MAHYFIMIGVKRMSNSPNHVLSRILHRDDSPLNNWPKYERELLEEKIKIHISKCKHPKCIEKKQKMDDLVEALHYAISLNGKDV